MGSSCIFSLSCNTLLLVIASVLLLVKLWYKMITGKCRSDRRLDGKTVIVTGANTGIGKETARDLARRGARVIMTCRDLKSGKQAQDDIITTTGNKDVILYQLNLSCLSSVREFAAAVIKQENRLDVLINNAGAIGLPYSKTVDGLNELMQGNHFGPFLLTLLLLDLLKKSAPSRIIMVSSHANYFSKLNVDDLNYEQSYSAPAAYSDSKLANILVSNELSRKLNGTGVTVNSLHPGVVKTDIARNYPRALLMIIRPTIGFFLKTPTEGAQTSIYLAVSEDLEGVSGKYFADCKEDSMTNDAQDEGLAKKLWEKSEELVGLKATERFY